MKIKATELESLNHNLSIAVDLYEKYKSRFVTEYSLDRFIDSEPTLKAIWSTYLAHNLKVYGDGPPTLELSALLSADILMCSQFTTIALNIYKEFGYPDDSMRPISFTKSYIGDHSQILYSFDGVSLLLDPTTGMLVDGVTLYGLFKGYIYPNSTVFSKSSDLDWYINNIKTFYSDGYYSISNIELVATGYNEWTYDLRNVFGFDDIVDGVRFLLGSESSDRLIGSSNIDSIFGREGNDILSSNGPYDKLYGGPGNDKYFVNSIHTSVIESVDTKNLNDAGGNDKIFSSVSFRLPGFVESLTLTGNKNINAIGNALKNTIYGNAGDNKISAGRGADTIIGGEGADILYLGSDLERDICKYLKPSDSSMVSLDKIYNFRIGIDKIDLSYLDSNVNTQLNDAFKFDELNANPYSVWIRDVGHDVYVHADTTGDMNPEISICIIGNSALSVREFIL